MKYVRTSDKLLENKLNMNFRDLKQSDSIEELCDCYSYDTETTRDSYVARSWKMHNPKREIYGCIKTAKGLIYVAKMNEKGELELL